MRLGRPLLAVAGALAVAAFSPAANADILITIDKSVQQMTVKENGALLYTWPVSTGAPGYDTPSGDFKPFRMEADHFSREWDDARMPHSIFFTKQGHAIHGSNHVKAIGTPASHGCVRLLPQNASILFDLVKQQGMNHTRVVLTGETPERPGVPVARRYQNTPSVRTVASADDDNNYIAPAPSSQRLQKLPRGWQYARPYYPRYYYYRPYYPYRPW
jgi:hypothetical protein